VFVEKGGYAELRTVEVGHENGLEAEVTKGLEPGERIVLHPGDRVSPGTRLEDRARD
jgi:HlyD family secretion protein